MIECASAAACDQIAAAQVQFITDAIPATMLLAVGLGLVYQQKAGQTDE